MNTISAIETHYKGYRFRSRLEARWAMFYDLIGMPWSYETEPVSVNGEAYLPDFKLHFQSAGFSATHEVKSLHEVDRIRPITVYLAGKMKSPSDWRGVQPNTMYGLDDYTTDIGHLDGATFLYGGPYILADDHRGAHSPWVRHMAEGWCGPSGGRDDGRRITAACFKAIKDCDLLCAHINAPDAYGTLTEIGFALGLGIPVSVTVAADLANSLRRPDWSGGEWHDPEPGAHDLWFAQEAALHKGLVPNDEAARQFHAGVIRAHTCREYRLISSIGMATKAASMTFGDPLDVANRGSEHRWGINLTLSCQQHRDAAERVRAHRFDRH